MNKLFPLLKALMSGGIQIFNYRATTTHSRHTIPVLLASLFGVIMLFSAIVTVSDLKETSGELAILSIYTLVTAVIIVTEGIYKSGDLLFKPRDNDALLAMPLKKSTIILARMIKFYLFEMIYCLIFLLPAIIAYAINVAVGPSYYFVAMTMLLFVPIIPITISCLAGLIISAISARFKYKSLLQTILSFAMLFVTIIGVFLLSQNSNSGGSLMSTFGEQATKFYYPAAVFVDLVKNFDFGQYLIFLLLNLAIIIITVFIISRFYFKIVSRLSIIKRQENVNIQYKLKKHSQTFAIIRKELSKYFSTSVLITNTAIGLVLFLVVVGALCLNFDSFVASLTSKIEDFPLTFGEIYSYLPSVAFALVLFTSLMTFITATMISLEGKAFNLLKSLPITGRKVIMAKVFAAVLLIASVTIFGTIFMFIRFQFGFLDGLLVLVAAIFAPLMTELIGILVNLKYARFDAENDAVIVRQSASIAVATFLSLGMVLTLIPLTLAIVFSAGQTAGLSIMDAVLVITSAFLYFAVVTRGEERYLELSA